MSEIDTRGQHPELAIGIPAAIVTAKTLPAKVKLAAHPQIDYRGPLTLTAAIEAGAVSPERAEQLICAWERETGRRWGDR